MQRVNKIRILPAMFLGGKEFSFSGGYIDKGVILEGAGIFFLNHLYSFLANYHNDKANMPKVRYLMASAYTRIVPMHIIIAGGFFLVFYFYFFKYSCFDFIHTFKNLF